MNIHYYKKINQIFGGVLTKGSTSRNAVLVVIGDGINFTSTIITTMILSRIITVEAMGTYRQVIYLSVLALSLVEFGLSSSIYRFWNILNETDRSTFIKMQLSLSILLGSIASITLAILAPFLSVWYNNSDLKLALLIVCAVPLLYIVPRSIRPIMICRGKPLAATLLQLLFSLTSIFAIIIPFYFTSDLNKALLVWMAVNFIQMLMTFIILRNEIKGNAPLWNTEIFKRMWDYLWPLQAGRVPGIFTTYTDKIVTSFYLSTTAFAAYSLGARELPFVGKIGYSVSSVMVPKLVQAGETGNIQRLCSLWKSACEKTSLFTYPIIGFCVWFSVPIVSFLYTEEYKESGLPFAVFASITYIRVIEYASLAKALGRTELIMKSAFLSALTMVILSFPLTARLGIWGISLALLTSQIAAVGYLLKNYTKVLHVSLIKFYPWKRLIVMMIISLISPAIAGFLLEPVLHYSSPSSTFIAGQNLVLLFFISMFINLLGLMVARIIRFDEIKAHFMKFASSGS